MHSHRGNATESNHPCALIHILLYILEMETFENWYPGMVSSAEEYNLLKMMLMRLLHDAHGKVLSDGAVSSSLSASF